MRFVILSAMIVALLAVNLAIAGDCCQATKDCCYDCGCQKVCKVVCTMKKVKKTVWVVECEEFCAPLPNCRSGRCCSGANCCSSENRGSCGHDSCGSVRKACMVPPKCGPVRCRKKLVKKQIVCEVPVYKCVVVSRGGCCETGCGSEEAAASAKSGQSTTAA
ncbi:MAG: hypothetical protein U9N87_13245, partial [Planctomycetota bacterium]|nr:hypothetical protein [Planctomycetota bacterium]